MQAMACVTGVFVVRCVPSSTDRGLPQSSGNRAAVERQSSGNRAAIEPQSSRNRVVATNGRVRAALGCGAQRRYAARTGH
jgi:hypothetical protein